MAIQRVVTITLAGAFCLGATVTAQAAGDGPVPKPHFSKKMLERMDENGDGRVSLSEFMEEHERRFEAMDRNDDGLLDADEIGEHMQMMRERFKHYRDQAPTKRGNTSADD